jgi:hypothetical protein
MGAKAFFMSWTGRLKSPTELRGYWSRGLALLNDFLKRIWMAQSFSHDCAINNSILRWRPV